MKNIFVSFALLVSVLAVSCKKENEIKPQSAPATVSTINLEYRIQSVSGNVKVDYIAPNANGSLEMMHEEIDRTEKVISFSYETGHSFSVSASNVMPSHDVVQVQIYVNGELKVEGSTTNPLQSAIAQGNY